MLVYAWLMPASTVLQAVIGGITVLTGLLWWTVAVHLLVSMAMVWLATVLYVKIGQPDDGIPTPVVPKPLRHLTLLSALALSATLVTGTTVTGAGPHAGDKSPQRIVPRLEVEIIAGACAPTFLFIYLSLLIGLGAGLFAVYAPRSIMRRLLVLVLLVMAQGLLGAVQFFTGCPPCWSPFTSPVRRPAPRHRRAMGVDATAGRAQDARGLTRPPPRRRVAAVHGFARRADTSPAQVRQLRTPAAAAPRRRR